MNRRGALLARGMRWRLGASLLTVLAATIAVATAVLGPLYLHAAGDSVLRRAVITAPPEATGLTVGVYTASSNSYQGAVQAQRTAVGLAGHPDIFGTPILSIVSGGAAHGLKNSPYQFDIFSRTGVCGVLHFVSGGCRLGAGDGVVSARSARDLGVGVGARLDGLRVTGIYAIPNIDAPYWWGDGQPDFPYGQPSNGPPKLDPVFVSPATALAQPSSRGGPETYVQLPLRTHRVDLADETSLRRIERHITAGENAIGIRPSTSLSAVLDGADQQRSQMTTIVAVAAIQLVLLAVWVLASLLVRSAEARQSEARAARLRGFPGASMVWVTAAEPGLLCLLGAVLGVAIAWVAVVLARSSLLQPGSSVAVDGWTIVALVLALLAIAAALGLSTVRLLRSTELSPGATRSTRTTSVAAVVVDAILVVLAVAALVALSTTGALSGGHSNPLAAAAPGLIALGAAVLTVQLILLACRLGVRVSGDWTRVAPFLALRQTARRPGVLRQARVLVIALCLACFAIAAWSVARTNRATAAQFQVGARTVVTVATVTPTALERAVDRADPRGRFAMAALSVQTPSATMLAVDAHRLVAASSWPRGISSQPLSRVATELTPATAPPVTLAPVTVRATAQVSATPPATARLRDIDLDLWVFDADGGTNIIQLGALRDGVHSYAASLGIACPGGCRLTGVGVAPPTGARPPAAGTVHVALTGLSENGRTVSADLTPGAWRVGAGGVAVDTSTRGRLALTVPAAAIDADESANPAITPPMAAVADAPRQLPVVPTAGADAADDTAIVHSLDTQGLDGNTLTVHPEPAVTALPSVGADAVMADLDLISRVQINPTSLYSSDEVWLGPRAPADAVGRLRAAGLDPVGVQRASTLVAQAQHTGPALADDFLLASAIAALLVAAASTLGTLGATTRERATELTSLRVAGVPRRSLAGALGLESGILLLTAICGAAAGVLAAALALPSLPERAAASLAPLQLAVPVGPVVIVTVAVLLAVALVAGGVAAVLLRRMSPTLLRSAPDDISL